ncbi:MAG TPA: 2-hydroxychromene-2-carboxylate isomerase [Burkholderiales bacterium]
MAKIDWYFDFVSPYSYLALHRLPPAGVSYKPVLFAGLLQHWGHKGPAEMPSKRLWTYRSCTWLAGRLGVAFRFPAAHPFNPLPHLRLAIACGSAPEAVKRIFSFVWMSGANATDPQRFESLCQELGVDPARLASQEVKDTLRANTEAAAARGVFGVPTLVIDGELFWGADAMDFAEAFLADPALFQTPEMQRLASLPIGAARGG